MKRFLLLLPLLSGCQHTESSPAEIVKIGERDGVRIYRFSDNGEPHYFVAGPGSPRMVADKKPVRVEPMQPEATP